MLIRDLQKIVNLITPVYGASVFRILSDFISSSLCVYYVPLPCSVFRSILSVGVISFVSHYLFCHLLSDC